jgi:uncharacterized protein (DUF433 family)
VLKLKPELPPIEADQQGVLRVGGTRVTLDTVVAAFEVGLTPEEILLRYDTLRLDDVYLTIGYYLRNRAELDAYLAERRRQSEAMRAEAATSWSEIRQRLLARRGSNDTTPRGG